MVLDTPSPLIVGPSEVLIDRCQRSRIPLFEFIPPYIPTSVGLHVLSFTHTNVVQRKDKLLSC